MPSGRLRSAVGETAFSSGGDKSYGVAFDDPDAIPDTTTTTELSMVLSFATHH